MKCEHCHKADAKKAVTVKEKDGEREIYVCDACAARLLGKDHPSTRSEEAAPSVSVGGVSGEPPPPFVEEFVKATLGFMKNVAEAEENEKRSCPACGANWNKIKESGRLGCPACWKTFAKHIRAEFLAAQFGQAHRGHAPAVERLPDAQSARSVLERDLKNAIAREDYRLAAELKRKLDSLPGGKETSR